MNIDPAEFDEKITEYRSKTIERVFALLTGTTDEYDNIQQVLDEFAYNVMDVVFDVIDRVEKES